MLGVLPLVIATGPARRRGARWARRCSAACSPPRCSRSSSCRCSTSSFSGSRSGARLARRATSTGAPAALRSVSATPQILARHALVAGALALVVLRRRAELQAAGRSQTPASFRGADATPAPPDAAVAGRSATGSTLFNDETLTTLVTHGAEAELRSAHRGRARAAGARATRHYARPISSRRSTRRRRSPPAAGRQTGANRAITAGRRLRGQLLAGGFSLGWELDVWGRLRRLTESARAQYLATEAARRGVVNS